MIPFFEMDLEITGGNAEVFENKGVDKKAIRKLMKTKGRFCKKQQRVMRDVKVASLWFAEMEMGAGVRSLRSPSSRTRAEE